MNRSQTQINFHLRGNEAIDFEWFALAVFSQIAAGIPLTPSGEDLLGRIRSDENVAKEFERALSELQSARPDGPALIAEEEATRIRAFVLDDHRRP